MPCICVQQDESNATHIAEALEGKENEDRHEDTERLLQEMNEIDTEATHSDEDTPQDTKQLLEEINEVLKNMNQILAKMLVLKEMRESLQERESLAVEFP